jgi:amidase
MSSKDSEFTVLLYELKADLNAYLAELSSTLVHTLEEIIAFNEAHTEQELPYFGQDTFIKAQATTSLDDPVYLEALARNQLLSRQEGIDAVRHGSNPCDTLNGQAAWAE